MNSNEFDIVRRLVVLRNIFNDDHEPVGREAARVDKRMRKILDDFMKDMNTVDDFDVGKLDALIGELDGLRELRQMMELATEKKKPVKRRGVNEKRA